MKKRWVFRPVDEQAVQRLAGGLGISPILARILFHRGNHSPSQAHDFLCPDLSALAPPARMADLPRAVTLLRQAAGAQEKVFLVGDYDVDGLTSSALLYRTLRQLGAAVEVHIPHRLEEGYGLKPEVVRRAAESGVRLLVTVDCGTTSFEELELAARLGLRTVVVDHHELEGGRRPPASAFLNPLQPGCDYPDKGLASVGVAFTLVRELLEGGSSAWEHLDLVALGTVADMAPLSGENRILVRAGLHALSGSRKAGLKALIRYRRLEGVALETEDVSFSLAPLLNAMGRTGSAEVSFRLLVTEDPAQAEALVRQMGRENRIRSSLEREAFKQALAKVARQINFSRDRVIVLEDERWHLGVAGIVATRVAARFHRPTVVIVAGEGTLCRGSARSIRAFHLVEAFEAVKEHLVEFGGHPWAAGLTIRRDRIDAFRQAFNQVAHSRMDPAALSPCVELDGVLPLSELNDRFMRDLELLAPFGAENPRPVFVSEDARFCRDGQPPTYDPLGLRVRVECVSGGSFQAVQPRQEMAGDWNLRKVRGNVTLAYSPIRAPGSDGVGIQLKLNDLRLRP